MQKISIRLTTAQFAKLHEVNKRTLHYYDDVGLFSPCERGENGYRYYDISQSVDFEYIRMLKDLNMSIEEIAAYLKNPGPDKFIKIAEVKEKEIEKQIKKLKHTKKTLHAKKEQADFCKTLKEQEIKVTQCEEEKIRMLPYDFAQDGISKVFAYVKDVWSIEQIHMGIGGFISLDKVMNKNFNVYDGVYTPDVNHSHTDDSFVKAKGKYLCGYQKGTWDKLPDMYEKMIAFAKQNDLKLTGYAYEIGLNEFMISNSEDYITRIMIKIVEEY